MCVSKYPDYLHSSMFDHQGLDHKPWSRFTHNAIHTYVLMPVCKEIDRYSFIDTYVGRWVYR